MWGSRVRTGFVALCRPISQGRPLALAVCLLGGAAWFASPSFRDESSQERQFVAITGQGEDVVHVPPPPMVAMDKSC